MPPSAERKRAGFVISERLWVGMYGETFRAAGAGRRDLHALVVDPRIGKEPGVGSILLDDVVPALRPVHHRAIVGTVAAVRDAGDLLVVTEAVPESVSLHDLLTACRSRNIKMPSEIAAAVGRAVIDAAATAHAAEVVHGAIHPRSVLIDGDGNVRLADFAIGRAMVTAVAGGAAGELLRGLTGYVAPEIALGDDPSAASDVFALGAMLYVMLSGELPPGTLNTSPAMERLVQRALDTELARRFTSAIELQENFAEALEDDRWDSASLPELARFVARSRVGDALDAATEDLLASLGSGTEPPTRNIDLGADSGSVVTPLGTGRESGSLDSLIADLEDGDEPLTEVDGHGRGLRDEGDRDPISEMLAIERARTGAPVVEEPEAPKHRSGERARRVGATASKASAKAAAVDAIASLEEPAAEAPSAPARLERSTAKSRPISARPAVLDPFELDPSPTPSLAAPRKLTGLVWLVVLLAAGAALVWVIMDLKGKNRDETRREQEALADKERKEKELEAQLADPGAIRVSSTPDEAAVWLMLGRTNTDSIPLPSGMLHELRIELEGHLPVDLVVAGKDWTGEGNTKIARVSAQLVAGTPAEPPPPMPATPPEVLGELQRGLVQGRGVIHIESTPSGAAVWLLVGKSGSMKLEGIEAGRDYELKVLKKGFTPGYVQIKAEEWRNGGDPRLPLSAAPKHPLLERQVELVELPAPAKKPR